MPGILSVTASEDGVWFSLDAGEVRRVEGGGSVGVGTRPLDLASAGRELWVAAYDDKAAKRVDGESLEGTGEVRLGAGPVAVAVGQDAVGVAVQSP